MKVYNLEIEEWHTYYVSSQNVLVHNICSEYVPNNLKWRAPGTHMWTWAKNSNYKLSFGKGTDIGKMFVSDAKGEIIGEIHSSQQVKLGTGTGEKYQIHFQKYIE